MYFINFIVHSKSPLVTTACQTVACSVRRELARTRKEEVVPKFEVPSYH